MRSSGTHNMVTVSLAQIDVVWGQPQANLAKAEEWTAEAKRRGSDVIVFPELWTTGYDLTHAGEHAAEPGDGTYSHLAALARKHALFVTGSILKREGHAIYNCAPLFAPTGDLLGDYDKIHLFGLMDEDRFLTAGDHAPIFDLPWGRSALAICYDLRFPELFRRYALLGAEMILLCAEWPHPRLEHWRTLLRARAIENECFLIACNRVGSGGDARFFGHSSVIDPWGETLLEAGDGELLLTVSLDLHMVQEVRRRLPVLQDRRPDIYEKGSHDC